MDNVIIRKANIDDLRMVQELNNILFELEDEKYDSTLVKNWPISEEGKEYFSNLINNNYVIVATTDDVMVGYLAGTIDEKVSYEKYQYGEINNMLVKDEYRGMGVGKLLIDDFKVYCKSNNIYNLKVVASYKNRDAIEFYQKNGFTEFDVTLTANI